MELPCGAQIWRVVGGSDRGGIIVRADVALGSSQVEGRLVTGATVEELSLRGDRLHYRKLTGIGPEVGWVSVRLSSGKALLVRAAEAEVKVQSETENVRFSLTSTQYCLLCSSSSGEYLAAAQSESLSTSVFAGDECIWLLEGSTDYAMTGSILRSAVAPVSLRIACAASGSQAGAVSVRIVEKATALDGDVSMGDEMVLGTFMLINRPAKMPSQHLTEMEQHGYTIVDQILELHDIAELKRDIARVRGERFAHEGNHDGHFWMMDMLRESAVLGRAVSHPIALWVLRQYLGGSIHYCHQPIVNTLKPAKRLIGTDASAGQNFWHSDYPYHEGHVARSAWAADYKLGVQFNVCVDEFRSDNGATQFIPGSHKMGYPPPNEMNGAEVGSQLGAIQFQAPAGSAIMYDARMWHRQCPELNVSGCDRIALLNAVSPSWVVPMLDKTTEAASYAKSSIPGKLSPRDRQVLHHMCCAKTASAGPGQDLVKGMPSSALHWFGLPVTSLSPYRNKSLY